MTTLRNFQNEIDEIQAREVHKQRAVGREKPTKESSNAQQANATVMVSKEGDPEDKIMVCTTSFLVHIFYLTV